MKILSQISHRLSIYKALVLPFLTWFAVKEINAKNHFFSIGFIGFFQAAFRKIFSYWKLNFFLRHKKILFWPLGVVSPSPSVILSYVSIFVGKCKIFPHSFSAEVKVCSLRIVFVLLHHLWTDRFKILLNFQLQRKFAKKRKGVYNFTLNQCVCIYI